MSAHGLDQGGRAVMERAARVAALLLASAAAFFFLAFVFGYVYLRSLNNAHLWRPKGIEPPIGLGTAFVTLVVASAVAVHIASRDERRRSAELAGGLLLGAAALVVQVVGWARLGFGPSNGGYASVFVGWTGFYFVFALIALIAVEVQLVSALRRRHATDESLASTSFLWSFLAGIGVASWVVLYLV